MLRNSEIVLDPTRHLPVFATQPDQRVSKRYTMVQDGPLNEALSGLGWYPTNFMMMRRNSRTLSRDPNALATGKHLIRFRNEAFPQRRDSITELIMVNAHDRTGAFEFFAGIFGTVCSNGCIALRDGLSFKIYHINLTTEKIIEQALRVAGFIPTMIETEELFRSINLTPAEQLEYAQRTIDLRWDGQKFAVNPSDLIQPAYAEQASPTLWNTFQNVQRNLMNGGNFQVRNLQPGTRRPVRKVQGIKQIKQTVDINTGLWATAEKFAVELGHSLPALPAPVQS